MAKKQIPSVDETSEEEKEPKEPKMITKAKSTTFTFTPLLKMFIANLQNTSGIIGEEISVYFNHPPSWFSDIKTGKRKQMVSTDLAEIMAFAFNCENSKKNESFEKIDFYNAARSNLDVQNTIVFFDYIRDKIELFLDSLRIKDSEKLSVDIKNEMWVLVMLFEYDLIAVNGPHKIGNLLSNLLLTSNPKRLFSMLGENQYLPNRYKTKYFHDKDTKEIIRESITINKNHIYAEKSKNSNDFPLFFVNYDLINTDEYIKQNETKNKKSLPDGCESFNKRVELYEAGRIRLMDLFMLLRRANYLPCHSNEYNVFEKVLMLLYEREILTYYYRSEWVKPIVKPVEYRFQFYDFDNYKDSGVPAFLGLVDFFESIDIPEQDVDFTNLKNNFLKFRRTFLKTISFDFSFIENLSTIQHGRLCDKIQELLKDFKNYPDK